MISPELRRTPSISSTTPSIALPPSSLSSLPSPPQVSAPVTFNGQSFSHLPPHLAAAIGNLQPFPISSRGQHAKHPLPMPPPPLPQVSTPVTFNRQSFSHLPPHLAAALGNLQPFPTSSRRGHSAYPLSVSYLLSFFYSLCL